MRLWAYVRVLLLGSILGACALVWTRTVASWSFILMASVMPCLHVKQFFTELVFSQRWNNYQWSGWRTSWLFLFLCQTLKNVEKNPPILIYLLHISFLFVQRKYFFFNPNHCTGKFPQQTFLEEEQCWRILAPLWFSARAVDGPWKSLAVDISNKSDGASGYTKALGNY